MPEIQEPLPKYQQVAAAIRTQILRGELRPGDEVPSERVLAEEWGISRPTATRALASLRVEGLVEARQGSGTFVREAPRLGRRARDRYERAREIGRVYTSGERAEILSAEIVAAPERVCAALALEVGDEAIRRQRLIRDATRAIEVSTSWFEAALLDRAPRLVQQRRIREGTLAYVERVTGRRGRRGRDRISARSVTRDEARLLGLPNLSAVLVIEHTAYDRAGRPMEFAEAVYPPDRWIYEDEYDIGL